MPCSYDTQSLEQRPPCLESSFPSSTFLTRNLCASVCRQCVCWCDRAENRPRGEQPAHPTAPKLPFRQNGDADNLPKPLALQLPAGTSAQVRHRHTPRSPGSARAPKLCQDTAVTLGSSLPTLFSDVRGLPLFQVPLFLPPCVTGG